MSYQHANDVLARFPRLALGTFPTPLQPLDNVRARLGAPSPLYIKRDDLTGLGVGGNKTRNLEYLLGDAKAQNADVVFASGKSQSNLCALTVSACRKAGLDCVIFHNDVPPARAEGNVLLNELSGADLRYIGDIDEHAREAHVQQCCAQLTAQGRHPYVIRNGASTALGSLGYVHAMAELCAQCEAESIPLRHLFVPGGNGGLAAGVIFGAALTGAPFHIHVISVEYEKPALDGILSGFLRDLQQLTGELTGFAFEPLYTVYGEFRGQGWGISTPESVEQIYDLARTEGIFVEKVYTSKTLFGMLELIRTGRAQGPACYLHSGGIGALFSQF